MMMLRIPRIARDTRGATIIEFAIVAPVMAFFMLGAFDTAHTLYMRGVLQGIVQKTARDSGLEASTDVAAQAAIDTKVTKQVKALAGNATIVFSRRFYRTFSDAATARAEVWTQDTNGNGVCDAGEPFTDTNNNGIRDLDGGDGGQGGAADRTLYSVTVSYPRMFPLYNVIGVSRTTTIKAATILENQPYTDQGSYAPPTIGNCP
ncbi:pilus assembly protein [Sphingomonas oligophenolica]|uniref:Pilus assembly protein n=2 Tax=Sphingomonas oligophenolica TaxID=301154 RepID=A0A502CKQ7_9SPHN|nr:pilus assembly protein [Sphingomonas oligophenolica]